MKRRAVRTILALSLVGFAPASAAAAPAAPPTYALLATHTIGGDGGWDYLTFDPVSHHLFVGRSTHVIAVDVDSGTVVGDIPGTNGVHGIALAHDAGRGFVSDGRDSCVTVFDLKTLAPLPMRPATGSNPDEIVYDSASKRVFAFNGRSHSATAIDAASGEVAGTIPLDGAPEAAKFDGKGKGYVDLEDKNAIVEFDTKTLKVLRRFATAPGEGPSGLAFDVAHGRLFAGCGNGKMVVVNTTTGAVVATLPIGEGVDGCGFDPGTGLAFASCGGGGGSLAVIHEDDPDHFTLAQTVVTQPRARTMALDPLTHRVYLVTADFGAAPAPTPDRPRPRPPMVPGTFRLLVVGPQEAAAK
jgi:DNA-binding beta-propeller fold protein YncE